MKESFFNRTFFWHGVYFGIASILIFLIEYFAFPQLLSNKIASTLISILPLITFMTLAGIAERKKNNGFLSYGKTFLTMFITACMGIIIYTIFFHFFTRYYAPEFMSDIFEKEMQNMRTTFEDQGKSDEEIDKIMNMSQSMYKMKDSLAIKFIGVLFSCFIAAITALIVALVIRKTPPITYFQEPVNQETKIE